MIKCTQSGIMIKCTQSGIKCCKCQDCYGKMLPPSNLGVIDTFLSPLIKTRLMYSFLSPLIND